MHKTLCRSQTLALALNGIFMTFSIFSQLLLKIKNNLYDSVSPMLICTCSSIEVLAADANVIAPISVTARFWNCFLLSGRRYGRLFFWNRYHQQIPLFHSSAHQTPSSLCCRLSFGYYGWTEMRWSLWWQH